MYFRSPFIGCIRSIEMSTKTSIQLVGRQLNGEEMIGSQNVQFSGCLRKVISQNVRFCDFIEKFEF